MKLRTRPRNYKMVEVVEMPILANVIIENTPSDPYFDILLPMPLIAV